MHHWQTFIASAVRGCHDARYCERPSTSRVIFSSAHRIQELIFLFSKSPVLSSSLDSYKRTQPEPSHRIILNNAHFVMHMGDDWRSCSLLPSDFRSGPVRSGFLWGPKQWQSTEDKSAQNSTTEVSFCTIYVWVSAQQQSQWYTQNLHLSCELWGLII